MTLLTRNGPAMAAALPVLLTGMPGAAHDGAHLGDRLDPWQLALAVAVAVAGYALYTSIRRRRDRRQGRDQE